MLKNNMFSLLFFTFGFIIISNDSAALYDIIIDRYEIEEFAAEMGQPHYFFLDVDDEGKRYFKVNFTLKKDILEEDDWECELKSWEKKSNNWKSGSLRYQRMGCCKMIKKEKYFLKGMFEDFKLPRQCPFQAGYYQTNKGLYVDSTYLPPYLPGDYWRFELYVFYGKTDRRALKIGVDITIDKSKTYKLG